MSKRAPPHSRSPGTVLVIGAGIAGLAAADYLQRRSFQVTVLEARGRSGGRICTDHSWTPPIDLGASWIHGIHNNPIAKLARRHKLRRLRTAYKKPPVVYADGRPLTSAAITSLSRQEKRLEGQCAGEHAIENWSLGKCLRAQMGGISGSERWLLLHFIHSAIEQEYGTEIDNLSQRYWDEEDDFVGSSLILPRGYDQIVDILAQPLEIRVEHEVTEVHYGRHGVSAVTSKGPFHADRAIVTVPLGVLKVGSIKFYPALPPRKTAAINNLRMSLLNKLFLLFPRPAFWPQDFDWIEHASANVYDWPLFFNLSRYVDVPILVGLTIGQHALKQETESDDALVTSAMNALRAMFPNKSVPDPYRYKRTRWAAEQFTRGSYCYIPPDASGEDLTAMAEPVGDRLFFAGEATHRREYGTAHGTFHSGVEAARRIFNLPSVGRHSAGVDGPFSTRGL